MRVKGRRRYELCAQGVASNQRILLLRDRVPTPLPSSVSPVPRTTTASDAEGRALTSSTGSLRMTMRELLAELGFATLNDNLLSFVWH